MSGRCRSSHLTRRTSSWATGLSSCGRCSNPDIARAASELVWQAIGRHAHGRSSPEHPAAWHDNFVHLQHAVHGAPFARIPGPRLYGVLDDLLGRGRWTWNEAFGWWPVLFPGFAAGASISDLE